MAMLTQADKEQLKKAGISEEQLQRQIDLFKEGFPHLRLSAPAIIGSGILKLTDQEIEQAIDQYESRSENIKVLKFVPASGAATRMFKSLFAAKAALEDGTLTAQQVDADKEHSLHKLVVHIKKFAFYPLLEEAARQSSTSVDELVNEKRYLDILNLVLDRKGLNYGSMPKGLLKFHSYPPPQRNRTSLEEHMVEGALYAVTNGEVFIHFTVSPEHQAGFSKLVDALVTEYENYHKVKFRISYSQQKKETDTVAVNLQNEPFREANGELLLRPAGHGALLSNLSEEAADLIFIKNIDNVVPDRLKTETVRYKKALAGLLLERVQQVQAYISALEQESGSLETIKNFIEQKLHIQLNQAFSAKPEAAQREYLINLLNRPMRVCGMVKNEGEPGGGPFWAASADGHKRLQIVESAQVAHNDPEQKNIFEGATHFNPVDLVCWMKDYKNQPFNLTDFRDNKTGFISKKSKGGRELKAMELPGLWNGAMADWITLFVEVPPVTFNPVKTVFDLLRAEHQPEEKNN